MTVHDDGRPAGRTPGARPVPVPGSSSRQDVLRLLATEGAGTVAALAARTGLHENTVRGHLDRLVRDGLATREAEVRTVRGRPRQVYRAVVPATGTGPDDPGPARRLDEAAARAGLTRLLLAGYGAAEADVAAAARQAGERLLDTLPGAPRATRATGADEADEADEATGADGADGAVGVSAGAAAQLHALTGHLDRLGFDPGPVDGADPGAPVVRLWRCPFLDLARARPEVVCAVHLGLARGVLDRVGGPLRADRLVPFAGPRYCDLHLAAPA